MSLTSVVTATLVAYLASLAAAQGSSCPSNGALSCQANSANVDPCCVNTPGGSLVQTQFWDANPSSGPADSWTIHGLWPDHCDGGFDSSCDADRAYTNITDILRASGNEQTLSFMQTHWTDQHGDDESFWDHEWAKHGTCVSTLTPSCYGDDYQPTQEVPDYFNRVVSLFRQLDSYSFLQAAGIVPNSGTKYPLSKVLAALAEGHDGMTPVVKCKGGAINEIWYYFHVRGSLQSGAFVAAPTDGSKGNCPQMVSYPPKRGGR